MALTSVLGRATAQAPKVPTKPNPVVAVRLQGLFDDTSQHTCDDDKRYGTKILRCPACHDFNSHSQEWRQCHIRHVVPRLVLARDLLRGLKQMRSQFRRTVRPRDLRSRSLSLWIP